MISKQTKGESKELGLVVKSKEAAYWTRIVDNLKKGIESSEDELMYTRKCLEMAQKELKRAKKEQ